jgi:hypothetical protein
LIFKNKKVAKTFSTKIIIFGTLICFLAQSCQYFNTVTSKNELLLKELKTINWNQVDEYPSITECENLDNKAQQKQCFFEFLNYDIQQKINRQSLQFRVSQPDTLFVKTTILPNGKMQFEAENAAITPIKIDSILQIETINFPKIKPATKRGMFVKTEFVLLVKVKKTAK